MRSFSLIRLLPALFLTLHNVWAALPPPCGDQCIMSSILTAPSFNCSLKVLPVAPCVCVKKEFYDSVNDCASKTCAGEDLNAVIEYGNSWCDGYLKNASVTLTFDRASALITASLTLNVSSTSMVISTSMVSSTSTSVPASITGGNTPAATTSAVESYDTPSDDTSGLTIAAKGGIGAAVTVFVVSLFLAGLFLIKRRHISSSLVTEDDEEKLPELGPALHHEMYVDEHPVELDGKRYSSLWVENVGVTASGDEQNDGNSSSENIDTTVGPIEKEVGKSALQLDSSSALGSSSAKELETLDSAVSRESKDFSDKS